MKQVRLVVGLAAFLVAPIVATAQVQVFQATLTPLNNSGVNGTASLLLEGDDLTVTIAATGLVPDMPHPQHIHGRFEEGVDGVPRDSISPPPTADSDGDGFVELAEGLPFYGPVILPLTSPAGGDVNDFPTAPGGSFTFTEHYDLSNAEIFAQVPMSSDRYTKDDLLPLFLREIVLHGALIEDDGSIPGGGTTGEIDGTAGYKATLPVASGEIVLIPEPSSLALAGFAIAGLLLMPLRGHR